MRRTTSLDPRSNYEVFNCNNFNIRYWSWNYRRQIPTRYSPVRHSTPKSKLLSFPFDLHVLSIPPAFNLSQAIVYGVDYQGI